MTQGHPQAQRNGHGQTEGLRAQKETFYFQ